MTNPTPPSGLVERLNRKIASKGAWVTTDIRDFYVELRDHIEQIEADRRSLVEVLIDARNVIGAEIADDGDWWDERLAKCFGRIDATLTRLETPLGKPANESS